MSLLTRFRSIGVALDPAGRRLRVEVRRLAAALPPSDRVLDLGSGSAPYAGLFPHRFYVTADLLSAAHVRCSATAIPFSTGVFDLVLCTEVLEHVPDPDATLREIRRVLRTGGRLVVTTPLTWGVHEPLDFHRWTDSGLRQLLEQHGFRILHLAPRGGILLCLAAMLLVIPWQLCGAAVERTWWRSLLFAAMYAALAPVALLLAFLDPLDRRRSFTHGYAVLCVPTPS